MSSLVVLLEQIEDTAPNWTTGPPAAVRVGQGRGKPDGKRLGLRTGQTTRPWKDRINHWSTVPVPN